VNKYSDVTLRGAYSSVAGSIRSLDIIVNNESHEHALGILLCDVVSFMSGIVVQDNNLILIGSSL
jgi:hypothetical protein